MLSYLVDSPIDGWLDHLFTRYAEGESRLALDLAIPVLRPEHTTVRGRVELAGTRLWRMRPTRRSRPGWTAGRSFSERGLGA